MISPRLTTLVPAAGRSERFGARNKLLASLDGSAVIVRTVETALAATNGEVLVVTERAEIRQVLAGLPVFVVAPDPHAEGLGHSIATGVRWSIASKGWLIWPGDMPFIQRGTVRAVVESFDPVRPVVPSFAGRFGHPVLFPAPFRDGLLALRADRGGRNLLSDPIVVEVDDRGILRDIDTPDDLRLANA